MSLGSALHGQNAFFLPTQAQTDRHTTQTGRHGHRHANEHAHTSTPPTTHEEGQSISCLYYRSKTTPLRTKHNTAQHNSRPEKKQLQRGKIDDTKKWSAAANTLKIGGGDEHDINCFWSEIRCKKDKSSYGRTDATFSCPRASES